MRNSEQRKRGLGVPVVGAGNRQTDKDQPTSEQSAPRPGARVRGERQPTQQRLRSSPQ